MPSPIGIARAESVRKVAGDNRADIKTPSAVAEKVNAETHGRPARCECV